MKELIFVFLALLVWLVPTWSIGAQSNPKGVSSLSESDIQAMLKKSIASELPPSVSLSIESIHVDGRVSAGATVVEFEPHPPLGVVTFQLRSQKEPHTVYGNAVVRGFGKIAVSRVAISHGETLSKEQIGYEERDLLPYLQKGYFLSDVELRGFRANGYIRPGTVLTASNTRAPAAVSHGQMVDFINRRSGLVVIARVKALEDGKINDWIQVENPDTHKILTARVSANGETETR